MELKKKTTFSVGKLDQSLATILQNPQKHQLGIAYNPATQEADVLIYSPKLNTKLDYVQPLGGGFYSGHLKLEYIKELAQREDIVEISIKKIKDILLS